MRFPTHRSVEERTEDLPSELGACKRCSRNPADIDILFNCIHVLKAGVYKSLLKSNHDCITTQFSTVDVASV